MEIYHFDENGFYKKTSLARKDPLDNSRFLIPRNATKIKPQEDLAGKQIKFNGEAWEEVEIPIAGQHEAVKPSSFQNSSWCAGFASGL